MLARKVRLVFAYSLLAQLLIILSVYLAATMTRTIRQVIGGGTFVRTTLALDFAMGLAVTVLGYRKTRTLWAGPISSVIGVVFAIAASLPLAYCVMIAMRPEHRGYPFMPLVVMVNELYYISGVASGTLLTALWLGLIHWISSRHAGQRTPPPWRAWLEWRQHVTVPRTFKPVLTYSLLAQSVIVLLIYIPPFCALALPQAYRVLLYGLSFVTATVISVRSYCKTGRWWVAPLFSVITGSLAATLSVFLSFWLLWLPGNRGSSFPIYIVAPIELAYLCGSSLGALLAIISQGPGHDNASSG